MFVVEDCRVVDVEVHEGGRLEEGTTEKSWLRGAEFLVLGGPTSSIGLRVDVLELL